jgi:hypothetical protein
MSQDVMIPDEFKNAPVLEEFASLNPQDESLTEGIGSSYAVISYRGKNWTFRYKGTTHLITYPTVPGNPLPTDGQPSNYIDVVILRKARTKSKSFYPKTAGGAGFNPDDIDSHKKPVCSSIDGIRPDPGVEQKQSDTCALCPQNEWKMQASTGREGRACQDRMRLAVIIMPGMVTPLLGAPLLEPMFLPIPPASLQGLSALGDEMEKNGKHFATYVTRILFKADKSWPEFKYQVAKMLTKAEAAIIMKLRADPMSSRIIGESGNPSNPALAGPGAMKMIAPAGAPPAAPPASTPPSKPAAPAETAVAAAQEAERKARIAAVRQAEAPPPKVEVAAPAATNAAAQAQIEELQAKLAALQVQANTPAPPPPAAPPLLELTAETVSTGVVGRAPDPDQGTGLGGVDPAAEESTPDLDAIIAQMMPQKPQ